MEYYLKQRVFTWADKFDIYYADGTPVFHVWGELFVMGKQLHLCDMAGNELMFVKQRIFSFLPRYYLMNDDGVLAEVQKRFTAFHDEFTIPEFGWEVKGDFFSHEYAIYAGERRIAAISKRWFTWGDTYEISVESFVDPVAALAVVLVIDAVLASK